MYEAAIKLNDGETLNGWMGKELPSKKGFTTIKLETAGITAFIPDEDIIGDPEMGKIVNVDDITISMPEKSKELTSTGKENPNGGFYKAPTTCKPGSKLDQIRILMDNNPGKSRAEYIALVVENGLGTEKGSSTYLNNAKPFVKEGTLSGWKSKGTK